MVWGKAGSDTLTTTGNTVSVTGISANDTLQTMSHITKSSSGNYGVYARYNDVSSGSLYHGRYETNGTTDQTFQANQLYYMLENSGGTAVSAGDFFNVSYQFNIETEEKLTIGFTNIASGTGAGTAPQRNWFVTKFANTSDQITSVKHFDEYGTQYGTGSNLSVLGSDLTPAPAVTFPSDVPDYTRAEITDTRKMYSLYGASTATYETDFSSDPTISSNDSGNNYYDSTNDRWYIQWDWDNTNDAGSIDLYSKIGNQNLSDDDWTVRFKYTIVSQNFTSGGDSKQFFIGLTSTDYSNAFWYPDSSNVSTNFGLYMDKSGTYQLYTNDNSAYASGTWTNTSRSLSNETLYVELIRENSTTAKMNLYSDSSYSTLLVGVSLTIASGLTGLRYLSVKGMRYSSSGTVTSNMDDLEIYNDVSSVLESPTWKEKGTT